MRRKKQKRPERRTPVEGTRRVTLVRIMRNSVMCRRTGKKSLEQKPNAMCWTVCSPCTSDEPKKSRACIRVSLNAHVPFCGESPEKQMQSVRVGYREMSFRLKFFLSYLVFHVHESRLAATFPRFVASRISRLSRLSTSLLRRSFFFLSRAFPPPLHLALSASLFLSPPSVPRSCSLRRLLSVVLRPTVVFLQRLRPPCIRQKNEGDESRAGCSFFLSMCQTAFFLQRGACSAESLRRENALCFETQKVPATRQPKCPGKTTGNFRRRVTRPLSSGRRKNANAAKRSKSEKRSCSNLHKR
uniref:Uncharacterized protein n=1 Tax=Toxoplasma gondii COUG TaxID=1074873 RepID=A0A2G8Y7Y1_TOXGO|nr:hypothetical protein TGCOUG_230118 [Toxoplasma gondii COUG]